jgi:hypothetical protein
LGCLLRQKGRMRSSIELGRGRRSGSSHWYDVRADPDRFSFEDSRIAVLRVLCLPDDEFVRVDVLDAPLLLVHICSHWRKIAMSTP